MWVCFDKILSRHAADEPLAVLADRKGCTFVPRPVIDGWRLSVFIETKGGGQIPFDGPTYTEAEAKARAYLNGLEDTPRPTGEGGKV